MLFTVIKSTVKAFFVVSLLTLVGLTLDIIYNPVQPGEYPHENIGLEIDKLVTKYGYPFEKHTITTEDGYILELHRIPHGSKKPTTNKKPIILMHGLLGNSLCFLANSPDKVLPYILAENGYDVWLPNARGNNYSRKHKTLHPDEDKAKFFNFSWNEIGMYDIPAVIDYVLKTSGEKKVYYAGHSQGSISFFVMLSERPEYNDKVRLMVGLAPVVYVKHAQGPSFYLPAMFPKIAKAISDYFPELMPTNEIFKQIVIKHCKDGSFFQNACYLIFNANHGFNQSKFNKTELPLYLSMVPAGSATKQLLHYNQIVNSDIFRKFDHGEQNVEIYGQKTPPEYKFENIKVPTALFYGNNDVLTIHEDFEKLRKKLPNVVFAEKVKDEFFMHFDFISSPHAVDVLYPQILDLLKKY